MINLIIGIIAATFAAFLFFAPKQWEALVDKENEFWVKRGLLNPKLADMSKRIEKSIVFKIIVGFGASLFLLGALAELLTNSGNIN